MINIICNESDTRYTKIQNEDGSEIKGVKAVDIRMRFDEFVSAKLWIEVNEINIQAEPLLSLDTVKEAAEFYGYQLVIKDR
jgi:hypothetical protein